MSELPEGNWTFRGINKSGEAVIDSDGELFALVIFPLRKDKKNIKTNACLMAAALALLAACEAWMKVESEMREKHPCPDLALRAQYRRQAVTLTKAAIAQTKIETPANSLAGHRAAETRQPE